MFCNGVVCASTKTALSYNFGFYYFIYCLVKLAQCYFLSALNYQLSYNVEGACYDAPSILLTRRAPRRFDTPSLAFRRSSFLSSGRGLQTSMGMGC